MSRLYDTIEPAVIDENLLKQCVEEQGPSGEAGKIAKKEGIDFKDVLELRLDFKNILKIDNMWRFNNLVKLQLDNNIIEKMEGFSMLVNLKWLDLSFNNIETIEGLENLTKLKDLTLFNNRIISIGNMDTLTNLHVLSLGNNKLEQLDTILYLRKFRNLNTLNLNGNPFCKLEEYHAFTIAHLPCLVYLDYRLIDGIKREEAISRYHDSIDELTTNEEVLAKKQAADDEAFAQRMAHKEAYVEDLNGPALFQSLFHEDTEASKLAQLPGVSDLLAVYEEKFTEISLKLFEFGLKEREKRNEEMASFFTCLSEAFEQNRNASVTHIEQFEKHKTKVLAGLMSVQEHDHIEQKLNELANGIRTLQDTLMGLELQLVDQLEETMKDFERNLLDMMGTFVENVQEHISQMRELESHHHEKLSDIAIITLEKLMKNELEEEMSDDVRMLFVDRDTIMNAVSASHDAHTFRIDNKEDDIVTRANTNIQTLIENLHADEIKRNRGRVNEISNLLDHYQDEIDNFENPHGM